MRRAKYRWQIIAPDNHLLQRGSRFCKEAVTSDKVYLLNWEDETRDKNPDYTIVPYHGFLRIPYDYIVSLDMETDPYSGYPSLYVEYAKNGMPFEEILYGRAGVYEQRKPVYYFDNKMRQKLP